MLFNSYFFIFIFLPLCVGLFYLLGKPETSHSKGWLLICSLWFYGYFNLYYLGIMIFSIGLNYLVYHHLIKGDKTNVQRKLIMCGGIAADLGVLFYFKYYDFFIENCNSLFGLGIPLKGILLPLGISFFTFQQIGFVVDAYRGDVERTNLLEYALFVSFFPQLVAGPIVSHREMLPQMKLVGHKPLDTARLSGGLTLFVLGLSKKILVADVFGKSVDFAWSNLYSINSAEALLASLFYTFQLYFDFSGYCDMAIGLGEMLGIELPMNFDSPYKSADIEEFWHRWHITLSRFFTRYVYIPLGGNRKGTGRMYLNLLIVFILSGLWHGAGWNFILWGTIHGILYVITRWVKSHHTSGKHTGRIPGIILTFIFVNFAWIFFRAPDISSAIKLIQNITSGNFGLPSGDFIAGFNLPEFWYILKVIGLTSNAWGIYICTIAYTIIALLIVFLSPTAISISHRINDSIPLAIVLGVLFAWCIVSLSGISTFLYFNF